AAGDLLKSGGGILVLGGTASDYAGNINILAGTLQVSTAAALGTTAGTTTIQSGAALDFVQVAAFTLPEPLTVSGTGLAAAPIGALINSTTSAMAVSGPVTLAGTTSMGGAGTGGLTLS